MKDRVLGRRDVLALHDRESGEAVGRYTTKAVREQELRALADAASVASGSVTGVGARAKAETLDSRALRPDQRAAFEFAIGPRGLAVIEGRAGTEKASRSLPFAKRTSAADRRSSASVPRMPSHRTCAARAALPALLRCTPSCSDSKTASRTGRATPS